MIEEIKEMKFGMLEGEVINICKIGADSTVCRGVCCELYKECYKEFNPDKDGYIKFIRYKK